MRITNSREDRHALSLTAALFLSLTAIEAARAQEPAGGATNPWTLRGRVGWDSKYISEGRDNLEVGGLVTFETAVEKSGFCLGAWYGFGDSEDYDELNLYGQYGFALGPFESYVGDTRLEFPEEDASDNELSAGTAYAASPRLTPAVDYVYSTEADGAFVEVSLRSEISLSRERVTLCPYVLEGLDFGYVSGDYDGPNNFQVGVELCWRLSEHLALSGYAARSWAHVNLEREGLGDESWGGLGIACEF